MSETLRLVISAVCIVGLLLAWRRSATLPKWGRLALALGVTLLGAYFVRDEMHAALDNLRQVREWDFLCFWLWGKMGASGANFYDPQSSAWLADGFTVTPDFRRYILDVGFWYPPVTMLLFAPLGFLPLKVALGAWYLVQALCLLACAAILSRLVTDRPRALDVAVLGTLLLAIPATHQTLWLGQTNIVLLVVLLLLWVDRERPRAGIWLALGLVVKPYFAVFGFFLLHRRNWKALGVGALTSASAALAALYAFGSDTFVSYLRENPIARLPIEVHSEAVNQSLYGTILRLTHRELEAHSMRDNVPFLLLALGVAISTYWLVRRSKTKPPEYAFSLVLTAGLLLYPSTLAHYALLLIVPLLFLWRRQEEGPGEVAAVFFIGLVMGATGISHGFYAFWSMAAVWMVYAVILGFFSGAARGIASGHEGRAASDAIGDVHRTAW